MNRPAGPSIPCVCVTYARTFLIFSLLSPYYFLGPATAHIEPCARPDCPHCTAERPSPTA